MRTGLATLEVLERENLGERATVMGEYLRTRLRETLSGFEMVCEIRGIGLLNGIVFAAPQKLTIIKASETGNLSSASVLVVLEQFMTKYRPREGSYRVPAPWDPDFVPSWFCSGGECRRIVICGPPGLATAIAARAKGFRVVLAIPRRASSH